MTRNCVYSGIAEKWQWEVHVVGSSGESVESLGWAVLNGKEYKEGRSSYSRKLTGLRMGIDSWQVFIGQEVSLSLL